MWLSRPSGPEVAVRQSDARNYRGTTLPSLAAPDDGGGEAAVRRLGRLEEVKKILSTHFGIDWN
jgi:hypothetical protein